MYTKTLSDCDTYQTVKEESHGKLINGIINILLQ